MNFHGLAKIRIIWLFLILLLSLFMVGIAVAAASSARQSLADPESAPPPSQNGVHAEDSLPASPFVTYSTSPKASPPANTVGEQMRQQAMAASHNATLPVGALQAEVNRLEFWKNPNSATSIWGGVEPYSPVTITTSGGDVLFSTGDEFGEFTTEQSVFLDAGDLVTVTAGAGNYPLTVTFPDLWANSSDVNNTVFGHIDLPDWEVEIHPDWTGDVYTTTTDVDGNFSLTLDDVPPQGQGYIRYSETVDETQVIFHRVFLDIDPILTVNFAQDWVEGSYDPGWQVAITVTNEAGDLVRGTAHGVTGQVTSWGDWTGFATHNNISWDGAMPDIQLFDHVYLRLEKDSIVHTKEEQVGEIAADWDYVTDLVTATFNIPWLIDPIWADCSVWVENGPGMAFEINPQGGTHTCDFASLGWDLLPGQDIGVSYLNPDGDRVINVFNVPVPHLYLNLETHNAAALGNNYTLQLHYNNDGWATASDASITLQLFGMTYLSDTSGITPQVNGNTVVWQLGDLPYNHMNEHWFDVFVSVDQVDLSAVGDIATSLAYWQGDEGSKHFEWTGTAVDNDADLTLNKWAWTGDPVADQNFVYVLNICNINSTSSAELIITDTLPQATTFVDWWGQQPGWQEVSHSDHELVVSRPTMPGYWCSDVYILVHLADYAWLGMPLHNEAVLFAESDPGDGYNYASYDQNVGSPSFNLHLDPNWVFGQFVPGGEVTFEFNFSNWGNMPMPGTVISTTIPEGTEFLSAYGFDWRGGYPFTPTLVTNEYVMWDLDEYPNGFSQGIGVRFRIADETAPGTPLVVENRITGQALEYRYDDNLVIFNETVNNYGPNLRVDKHTNWNWQGEGQLGYELRITNIGSQYLENVAITDTYPISTFVSWCGWNHGPGNLQPCEDDPENHQAIFRLDYLNPGESASASLNVDLLPEYINVQGSAFVNQVDISDYGDINPLDNHDEITSYIGPDIFARKWLKEGELGAGELITYTVEFGNLSKWSSDWRYTTHIMDTLPENTTFVRAIPYWDPTNTWEPESIVGQKVTWSWWPLWSQNTWTFDLVVQIDADYPLGYPLTNVIEAYGDSPYDIDFDLSNNVYEDIQSVVPPSAFSKILPLNGSTGVSTNPTLSWESSAGTVHYEYCYDTTDDDACAGAWTSTTGTSVALSGLSYNTTYYWQVRAVNLGGTTEANAGAWWSFTVKEMYTSFLPLVFKLP